MGEEEGASAPSPSAGKLDQTVLGARGDGGRVRLIIPASWLERAAHAGERARSKRVPSPLRGNEVGRPEDKMGPCGRTVGFAGS